MEHYQAVLAATRGHWAHKLARRRRRRIGYGLAAAIAGVGLAVLTALRMGDGDAPSVEVAATDTIVGEVETFAPDGTGWTPLGASGETVTAGARLRSGAEGRAGLSLVDGTSLRLDASTELSFERAGRIRLARGAVYLDTGSRPAASRHVEVVTPAGVVWDVGTQFEVRYEDDALTLRIREGRVVLDRDGGETEGLAGEQLTLDAAGRLERTAFSPFDPGWRWVQAVAPLPYQDTLTVHELLEWVARETGREVHFSEPGLATRASRTILHGNPQRLLPMEALAVMLETTDLGYTVAGDGAILIASRMR